MEKMNVNQKQTKWHLKICGIQCQAGLIIIE